MADEKEAEFETTSAPVHGHVTDPSGSVLEPTTAAPAETPEEHKAHAELKEQAEAESARIHAPAAAPTPAPAKKRTKGA